MTHPVPSTATYFGTLCDRACDRAYAVLYFRRGGMDTNDKTLAGKMTALLASAETAIEGIMFQAHRFAYASNPSSGTPAKSSAAWAAALGPQPYMPCWPFPGWAGRVGW